MSNIEGEPTVPVAFVEKQYHISRPQLYRAVKDLEPPLRTSSDGRIYEVEIPRIESAILEYRGKSRES